MNEAIIDLTVAISHIIGYLILFVIQVKLPPKLATVEHESNIVEQLDREEAKYSKYHVWAYVVLTIAACLELACVAV